MSKTWWLWAAAGLGVLGCVGDPSNGSGSGGAATSNVAGRANDSSAAQPARAGRGTVTLLASNRDVKAGTWTFSGPAEGAGDREDTVSCQVTTRQGRAVLEVSASPAGADVPMADLSLELLDAKPTPGAVPYDASSPLNLTIDVAFTQAGNQVTYRYGNGGDMAAMPASSSSCSVTVSELSEHWAVGQAACRNLLAGATSADATLPDGTRGRASATIAFDCPIKAFSAPDPGGIGGASAGTGAGGSEPVGGGTGGSDTSGSDSGGTGGSMPTPKSCHGVVTPCSLQGTSSCTSVQGCSRKGECTGLSRSCYSYFDVYSCSGQQGCVWGSYSKNCSGSSWGCDLMSGSLSCVSQEGCDWNDTCDGVATPCSLLGEFTCATQPGCTWD